MHYESHKHDTIQCHNPARQFLKAMRPQLPENALVTLIRQCYTASRCQARSRSLPRKFHTSRSYQRLSGPSFAAQRREYQTRNGGLEDGALRNVQFAAPAKSSSAPSSQQRHNIAVLGGGITGLSAAHYLTREVPTAKVTVYEAGDRLGGWLQSKSVDVGNGNIVFEAGPRTLRPSTAAGMVTVEMVR
jgi:oxygen-dependent protoporphyrinogen oxidase